MEPTRAYYTLEDPHPTVRCPECNGQLIFRWAAGPFWSCAGFPKCYYTCDADPETRAPNVKASAPRSSTAEIDTLVLALARDELTTREDALRVVWAAIGRKVRVRGLTAEEVPVARATLIRLRQELEAARPIIVREPPKTCCETSRDAYGAMTICWAARRWCLGVATHAARPEHTADLNGQTWGDGYDGDGWEDDLKEDAQAAFAAADTRRRR